MGCINKIAVACLKALNAIKCLCRPYIFVGQYTTNRNFGDALGLWIPMQLRLNSGRILPKRFVPEWLYRRGTNLQMVGSTLGDVDANSILCGAGAVSADQRVQAPPKKVISVRGPLTRNILLEQGIECPPCYGDPAIVLPLLYHSSVEKRYDIGLLPHYVDAEDPIVAALSEDSKIHLVDILLQPHGRKKAGSIKTWLDELCACRCVVSSSLHGLIIAEAYGIPTLWVKFSDNINGNDFKFYDYYQSIGIHDIQPVDLREMSSVTTEFLLQHASIKDTSLIDKVAYYSLLQSIDVNDMQS